MKRKLFAGMVAAGLLLLTLSSCSEPAGKGWVPGAWAEQPVVSGTIRFTDGHLQSAAVQLLGEDGLQRTFVLDGASGAISGDESGEVPQSGMLELPLNASDLECFAEACRRWVAEKYAGIAVFDVRFEAEQDDALAERVRQMTAAAGTTELVTYSVLDGRLAETDGRGLQENALGVGSITAHEREGALDLRVAILP